MQPNTRDVHIDVALTQVSVKYNNADLIAEKIFPVINVRKISDKYFTYGKQDLRIYETKRAIGSRAKTVEWTIDSVGTYTAEEHSLEMQLIDEVRDNADDPIRYDADSTEYLTNMLLLDLEKVIADKVGDTSNYASGHSGGPASGQWDDFVNSDPLKDVDDAKTVVREAIFRNPNTMIVNDKTHKYLRRHPKLLEMYKYTRGGVLSVDILKEIFEVDNYLIGGAGYLSSAEGATDTQSQVWGKNCVLLYIPPNPGLKMVSFGYIFRVQGYRMVERWRDDPLRSDWIRVSDKYDAKIISPYAGYLITNVIP